MMKEMNPAMGNGTSIEEAVQKSDPLVEAAIDALNPESDMDENDRIAILNELENVYGDGAVEELYSVLTEIESGGDGDGMSDSIPAMVDGKTPASLSSGEFVIPSDVVSGIGNGSTEAGAKQLQQMIDRIRAERTGTPAEPRRIDPKALGIG